MGQKHVVKRRSQRSQSHSPLQGARTNSRGNGPAQGRARRGERNGGDRGGSVGPQEHRHGPVMGHPHIKTHVIKEQEKGSLWEKWWNKPLFCSLHANQESLLAPLIKV